MAAPGGEAESREAKGDPAHGNWGLRQGWSSDCSGPGAGGKWPGAWKCATQHSGGSLGGKWATPAHNPFGVPRGRGVRLHRTRQAMDGGGKEGGPPTFIRAWVSHLEATHTHLSDHRLQRPPSQALSPAATSPVPQPRVRPCVPNTPRIPTFHSLPPSGRSQTFSALSSFCFFTCFSSLGGLFH